MNEFLDARVQYYKDPKFGESFRLEWIKQSVPKQPVPKHYHVNRV